METNASPFNPYQALDITRDEPALAPDTEFLFNDKVVAGIGEILLPQICVVTGATDSLVARESRLWWCARWIKNTSMILCLSAFIVGTPMLVNLPPGTKLSAPSSGIVVLLQLAGGVTLMVAAFASIAACFVFRRSVRVRWYISQQIVNRTFYLRLSILLAAIVTMFVIWFLTTGRFRGGPVMSGLWAVASLTSLIYLIRGKRVLVVIGRHKGLFLVGGLSEKFLIETKRLVEAHAAKKKGRVKLDAAD